MFQRIVVALAAEVKRQPPTEWGSQMRANNEPCLTKKMDLLHSAHVQGVEKTSEHRTLRSTRSLNACPLHTYRGESGC